MAGLIADQPLSVSKIVPTVPDLRIEVVPDRARVFVALAGELDLATAPALAAEIADLRSRGFERVVLDLRCLEFMDSTGLALILGELERSEAGAFGVVVGDGEPRRLLEMTEVLGALPLVRERDAPPRLSA